MKIIRKIEVKMSEVKEPWKPLSVDKIQEIFSPIPIQWWIAGGWALDLY
jgi:hypothetical protein